MMVSVETLPGLERRIEVSVPASRVRQQVDARLLKVSRTVRIKGFRPGKAPIHVVRKHYGPQVREEVVSDLIRETFAEALRQEKLQPAGGPRIEPQKTGEPDDLRYTATFEVYPQIELNDVSRIELARPVATVGDGDVDAMIESLRRQRPNWDEVARGCRDGDRITVDFEGRIGGEAFEGGKSENLVVVLGAGRLLPDFEQGVRGAAAGEKREFDLRFPDDYQARHLAGKTARFQAIVRKVEESSLPEVERRLLRGFRRSATAASRRCAPKCARTWSASSPRRSGRGSRRRSWSSCSRRTRSRCRGRSSTPRSATCRWNSCAGAAAATRGSCRRARSFEPGARRRVALGLILNEVIRKAGIQADAAQVQKRLDELVSTYSDPDEARRQYLQNDAATRQLQMSVLEDQAVDWVVNAAKVKDQPGSFKDIMNFGADAASEEVG